MRIAVWTDEYPVLSETFVGNEVRALGRLGHEVFVVSGRTPRPDKPTVEVGNSGLGSSRPELVTHSGTNSGLALADVPRARRVRDMAWLARRNPRGCVRDLRDKRSWRPSEHARHLHGLAPAVRALEERGIEHVHVHFAAHAALDALRAGRLLGLPVSITAHAYEIFLHPLNLERKLRMAAFATSGCAYNVRHLQRLAPDATIHEQVMGVDPEEFRRTAPHPGDRHVVAIGRLVEKKGFADLIDAIALMDPPPDRVTIVGDGPLRRELRERVARHSLDAAVHLAGPQSPEQIRATLETAAVLAMPCVVAADGDRDSMPVVVKEAMAMEVPVVATDEVGLPELVDDEVGRLVPPQDPAALARALGEVLEATPGDRAAMGAAGRARVIERANVATETARLAGWIEEARR